MSVTKECFSARGVGKQGTYSFATPDDYDDDRLCKRASVPNHQKDGVARLSKQEPYVIEA